MKSTNLLLAASMLMSFALNVVLVLRVPPSTPRAATPAAASCPPAPPCPTAVAPEPEPAPAATSHFVAPAMPDACDPKAPPYLPCCAAAVMSPNSTAWAAGMVTPKHSEFEHDRLYVLTCALTEEGFRAPWLCANDERLCESAEHREGSCTRCAVYLAGSGHPNVWTRTKPGVAYGPFTSRGASIARR